jgi:TatD DNase family protein
MKGFASVRAVFHCFTGTPDEARTILDACYLLGFTGAITFKKNDALREAIALTPMDRMLVETDAPYLTPEPKRSQKTNEPSLVVHVAETVARMKGISVADVDRQTTANVERLFSWPS